MSRPDDEDMVLEEDSPDFIQNNRIKASIFVKAAAKNKLAK